MSKKEKNDKDNRKKDIDYFTIRIKAIDFEKDFERFRAQIRTVIDENIVKKFFD